MKHIETLVENGNGVLEITEERPLTSINRLRLGEDKTYLKREGDRWVQSFWLVDQFNFNNNTGESESCGTAACFAGWAVLLHYNVGSRVELVRLASIGPTLDVPEEAQQLLGLTDYQANLLFSGNNNVQRLRIVVNFLVKEDNRCNKNES